MTSYYSIGSKGDDVKKLQQALTSAGYDPKGIDGLYGANTAAAVKAYQKANNLTQDGIAGTETLGSLYKPATVPVINTNLPDAYKQSIGTNKDWYDPNSGKTREQYEGTLNKDSTSGTVKTDLSGLSGAGGVGSSTKQVTMYTKDGQAFQVNESDVEQATRDGYSVTKPTDLTGINDINLAKADSTTPTGYVDPWDEMLKAALNKILNYDPNAAYDVTTDPQYAPLKQQYDNAGASAFNNQIGRLSALTGGRPSTAAVGAATQAQNNYAQEFSGTVLPGLISNEQTRSQNAYNNLANQLKALQGLSTDSYNQYRDTVSDTGMANGVLTQSGQINQQTIAGNEQTNLANKAAVDAAAHYDNIQAYINTLDPNDPEIPYLLTERQNKITAQNVEKTAAEKEAYERATAREKFEMDKKYTNAQINNMAADNAAAANKSSSSSSTSIKTAPINTLGDATEVQNYINMINELEGQTERTAADKYNYILNHQSNFIGDDPMLPMSEKLYNRLLYELEKKATSGTTEATGASDSLYNSVYNELYSMYNNGGLEEDILAKLKAKKGLSAQDMADIANDIFGGE